MNALRRAIVDPEELRQLLASLSPNETVDPSELANVLGGPGTQRIDMGDQPQRTMDSGQNALLRALQPYSDGADQVSRMMQRGPETPPVAPAPPPSLKDLPTDQLRDAYHPNSGGFVRNETTGKTLFLNGQPGGISDEPQPQNAPGGGTMADFMQRFQASKGGMPNPDLSGQGGPKIMPSGGGPNVMRVVGSGNGTVVDLGTEPAVAPSLDYARGKIDIPGVGRGYYGKDGNAYVVNQDGSMTKALLGYDMEGSMALNKYALDQQKTAADIAHTQEATRASQANNPDLMGNATAGAAQTPVGGIAGNNVDERLAKLDPSVAPIVKSMLDGRMAPPGGAALRNPRTMQLLQLANMVDPSFDESVWKTRYSTAQDFASGGKSGSTLTAFNTALEHLATLQKSGDALKNGSLPALNAVENWFQQQTGDPRITAFNEAKKALTGELTAAFNKGHITDAQLANWGAGLDAANSPEQLAAAYKTFVSLLGSKMNEMGNTYQRSMGRKLDPSTFISPEAMKVYNAMSGQPLASIGGAAGSQAPANGSGALAEARQAIQRGAPRDKVVERLRQAGIDATGL